MWRSSIKSLLAKQAWWIWNNPSSLVARVLEHRYFPQSLFFENSLGARPSYASRCILHHRELLTQGFVKNIVTERPQEFGLTTGLSMKFLVHLIITKMLLSILPWLLVNWGIHTLVVGMLIWYVNLYAKKMLIESFASWLLVWNRIRFCGASRRMVITIPRVAINW